MENSPQQRLSRVFVDSALLWGLGIVTGVCLVKLSPSVAYLHSTHRNVVAQSR